MHVLCLLSDTYHKNNQFIILPYGTAQLEDTYQYFEINCELPEMNNDDIILKGGDVIIMYCIISLYLNNQHNVLQCIMN